MVEEAPGSNRKSPRIELFAQAEVRGRDITIVSVLNLSSGGVYLEGTPEEYPDLKPGTVLDLVIFGSEEGEGSDPEFNIVCKAKVIRVDPGYPGKRPPGFGCTIDPVGQDGRDRLTNLLLRASGYSAGGRRSG